MGHHKQRTMKSATEYDVEDEDDIETDEESEVEEITVENTTSIARQSLPHPLPIPFSRHDIDQYCVTTIYSSYAHAARLSGSMISTTDRQDLEQHAPPSSSRRGGTKPSETLVPYQNITINLARERCWCCKGWFGNEEMVKRHQLERTRACQMCNQRWLCCAPGGMKSWAESPYCDWSCRKHGKCFRSKKEAHEHLEEATHKRCFLEGCDSTKAYGDWTQAELEKHFASRHR